MSITAPRQKLRTKTGCLTCRSRRKKCDEKTPVCERCSISGRSCQWPSSTDLLDRRYASHPRSRYSPEETILCLRSETTAHDQVTQDLEVFISRHFIDKYYRFLLLPNCHPDFYNGWINEIQELVVKDKSLHFSVLTNAASHIYNMDSVSGMQDLALSYYSKALRGLASMLEHPKESKLETHNGLLMSVMLLYLHGCMGQGTYADIPPHLNAAIRLLALRLFNSPLKISRPFDRLAVESVLYQAFLVGTGHWSDQTQNSTFDLDFWLQAEKLLERSIMYPGRSNSLNSPVLGVPVPLYRLAVQVKQIYQRPSTSDLQTLSGIKAELETWEAIVLCNRKMDELPDDEQPNREQEFYESASYLYALVTSLLLEQATACLAADESLFHKQTADGPKLPMPVPHDRWQIQKAIQIVEKYGNDDEWAGCYIGNWPVYTLGFFLEKQEHIDLVRNDLKRRWEFTSFMQIARFQHDLNQTWISRGQLTDSQAVWPDMDCIMLKPSD